MPPHAWGVELLLPGVGTFIGGGVSSPEYMNQGEDGVGGSSWQPGLKGWRLFWNNVPLGSWSPRFPFGKGDQSTPSFAPALCLPQWRAAVPKGSSEQPWHGRSRRCHPTLAVPFRTLSPRRLMERGLLCQPRPAWQPGNMAVCLRPPAGRQEPLTR